MSAATELHNSQSLDSDDRLLIQKDHGNSHSIKLEDPGDASHSSQALCLHIHSESEQMKESSPLRIAIVSDLHVSSDPKAPTFLHLGADEIEGQHPVTSVLRLIEREKLSADIVLCPGDLGHQADPPGVKYAWNTLQRVADKLGARFYCATAGNHDLDSRFQASEFDPDHILKGLIPGIPLQNPAKANMYWARAFTDYEDGPLRLLILNSSAYHGRGVAEKNHGRIGDQTLDQLRNYLEFASEKQINILLCHHHPEIHSDLGLGEDDYMKQGKLLLDILGCGDFGRWLVIHGHKHHPKLQYASGGASAPVIFSAGSFSCQLLPGLATAAKNQFYIMEIDPEKLGLYGLVGSIYSWDWMVGEGWVTASAESSGLPSVAGFGSRSDINLEADAITNAISGLSSPISWADLLAQRPMLNFTLPSDLKQLVKRLAQKGITVFYNEAGLIEQIGTAL